MCEPWTGDIPLQTPPGFRDSVTEYGQSVLERAAELARERAPHLEVDTVLEAGRVAEVLRREAAGAEQVVVGSRGLGGFTGLLLGSVSLALAGQVTTPVVVVRVHRSRHTVRSSWASTAPPTRRPRWRTPSRRPRAARPGCTRSTPGRCPSWDRVPSSTHR